MLPKLDHPLKLVQWQFGTNWTVHDMTSTHHYPYPVLEKQLGLDNGLQVSCKLSLPNGCDGISIIIIIMIIILFWKIQHHFFSN